MPLYEYRCRVCNDSFQLLRSVGAADETATCPGGHDDTVRALSLVAPMRSAGERSAVEPVTGGGGCCGGGCCN